jgi:hypothetical protein
MWSEGDSADDNELDRVINEAARRLTESEPPAVTARVLARLDQPMLPRLLQLPGRALPLTSLAAALAVIVFAIVVIRPLVQPFFHPSGAGRTQPDFPSPPPAVVATERRQPGDNPPQPAEALSPRRRSPTAVRSGPDAIDAAFALPALTASPLVTASLAIDPLASTALPAADSISVPPLEPIAPLAVPSIEEPQRD